MAVAGHIKMRSVRVVMQFLVERRSLLTEEVLKMLEEYSRGLSSPNDQDPFPDLRVSANVRAQVCSGVFLNLKN